MTELLRIVRTRELKPDELVAIRALMDAAFPPGEEGFGAHDWEHALGGTHFLVAIDGAIVSHASVVERALEIGGRPFRTGYVEAVATAPDAQRRGHGTRAMHAIGDLIRDDYEIGMLGTGEHGFYERLGWRTWRGPSFVRTPAGLVATPDDDGYIMVLPTPRTPVELDPVAPISCDWRPGDAW